jgi:hypothetical protein
MDKTLFARLATKYADGFYGLDPNDFEGVDHQDRLKLMEDVTGTDIIRVSSDDFTARVEAGVHKTKKKPQKAGALPARTFRYTMSTGAPVGPFADIVEVAGWNLVDFNRRGRPFLFGHNIRENRHPLGTMNGLLKGATEDRVRGEDVLAGNTKFTEEGLNPFNDLTHDMVASNNMPGGSVGFRIMESRAPTEEELTKHKALRKYSFISTKTSLVEFSSVPVGMDPDAVKRRCAGQEGIEARLALSISEGRYDEEIVAEFRHLMLGIEPAAKGRSHVAMSEEPKLRGFIGGIDVPEDVDDEDVPIEERDDDDLEIEVELEEERTEDQLTDEETEEMNRLETAIALRLVGEEEEEDGDNDTSDDASASEERTDDDIDNTGSTSSPDLSATIRALDRMGIPVDAAELERALVEPEPGLVTSLFDEEVRALREESAELRSIIERLEERLVFFEESLLPESASVEGGDESVSRHAGDEGDPDVEEPNVYEYLDDLSDADLRSLVETS